MKKIAIILPLLCLLVGNVYSQDIKDLLKKDLVQIENGKFKYTSYKLITLSDGSTKQFESHAEASTSGFISRDNFVAFFSIIEAEIISSILGEDADSKYLSELIGNPDAILNCYMTSAGLQIEIIADGETERITQSWEDL